MNIYHAWRIFKTKRVYAVLDSLVNSPIASVLMMFAVIGAIVLTLTCMWVTNYYLVTNEYLPRINNSSNGSVEGDAAIYCTLELIATLILGVLCVGLSLTVEETIAKLRIDLKKYDIEAAQYIDKRQS
jgi:hypothetical protein